MPSPFSWGSLAAVIIMKAIQQYITYEYQFYNSDAFHLVNDTCQLKNPAELTNITSNPMMYTIHFGYALSALGGRMANSRIGFRRVLICAGAVSALAAGLLACSISLGLVCYPAFYAFVWLLHPLYMGLASPCLFYGFVRLSWDRKSRMVLAALYYYSAEVSKWLDVFFGPILKSDWSVYFVASFAGACFGLLFLSITTTQKDDEVQSVLVVPTTRRRVRFFLILTSFTIFSIQLYDGHVGAYQREILLYSTNPSNNSLTESGLLEAMEQINLPVYVNMASMLGTSALLVIIGLSRQTSYWSHELRIQIGIIIAACVALFCLAADLLLAKLGPASPILTTAVFCTASFLDGASEILTMVAVYELIDIISTRDHKLMLFGVAFTIWTLAYFVRYLIRKFTFEVVMPLITSDTNYKYCVNHALNLIVLSICLLYTRCVTFPLAFTLVNGEPEDWPVGDETGQADTDRTPLLAPT